MEQTAYGRHERSRPVLVYSAHVAEILREGIESMHHSQFAIARSLGLT